MAKTIDINIKESEEQLNYLLRMQNTTRQKSRVKTLLLLKQGKVRYPAEISKIVKYSRRSVYEWLKSYSENGMDVYLSVASRGKRAEKLSVEEKEAIAQKLNDPNTEITSYVELMHWANQEFEKEIPYHVVYKFCRVKLKGRLKIARKSHYKKDEQAVEAFKKTTTPDKRI